MSGIRPWASWNRPTAGSWSGEAALDRRPVALFTAIVGLRQLRQFRADGRERSRPMMAAELRKAPYVPGTQLLVVRNYGPSLAHNVQVTFDPPIPDPSPERAGRSVSPFVRTETMTATERTAETLHLTGGAIETLIVQAPQNETLIIEICTF